MIFAICLILAAALGIIQWMIGGAYLAYSFPAYLAIGAAALLSLGVFRRPSAKPLGGCMISALVFGGYLLLRGITSPHLFLARADLFLVAACLVVYLLAALVVTSARARKGIVWVLFGVALAHTIFGVMQFTGNGGSELFGFSRLPLYGMRASGMLLNPDYLAGFLNMAAILLVSFIFWGRGRLPAQLVLIYLLMGCLMVLAMTGSRGGYFGFLAGLLVFSAGSLWAIYLCKPVRFSQTLLGVVAAFFVLIGGALSVMPLNPMLAGRLRQIGTVSWEARRCNALSSVEQFHLAPMTGTGAGTRLYYGRLFRLPEFQGDGAHAYNDYLELLAEYGAIGAVLGAVFLITHLGSGIQAIRDEATWRLMSTYEPARSDALAVTLGTMGAVAALLVHSAVDSNLHLPGNALVYAFLFGILGNPGTAPDEAVRPAPRSELALRGVLGFAGCVLLLAAAWPYSGERALQNARRALARENTQAALHFAARAVQKAPTSPSASACQGEAFQAFAGALPDGGERENAYGEAIAAYRRALERFPEDADAWARLGKCLDGVHRLAEAEEAWDRAVALDPNRSTLYAEYAEHLQRMDDEDGVQRCLEAARALDQQAAPQAVRVRNGLTAPALAP